MNSKLSRSSTAYFGTGHHNKEDKKPINLIEINQQNLHVISIDVPRDLQKAQ